MILFAIAWAIPLAFIRALEPHFNAFQPTALIIAFVFHWDLY